MPAEKAIVNVSQSVLSLNQGRLSPGGILRVADYFRNPDDVFRDVTLRPYVTSGYVQIQDIDFDALARARARVVEDEAAHAAELARQAEADMVRRNAEAAHRKHEALLAEGKAVAQAEAAQQVVAKPADQKQDDEDLGVLFESTRKQRIAAEMAKRAASPAPAVASPPTARPAPAAPAAPAPAAPSGPPVSPISSTSPPVQRKPVPDRPLTPDRLTDAQLSKLAVAFEVKNAKRLRTRAALLKAVQDLNLTPDQLQQALDEE